MPLPSSGRIKLSDINTELGLSSTTRITLGQATVRTLLGVSVGRIRLAVDGYGKSSVTGIQKAIFGYGSIPNETVSLTNLVSNTGIVASDTSGVGTARNGLAAAGYGGDKAIFGYGLSNMVSLSMTNLVSNTGVVSSDTPGVGTARNGLAAAGYGGDKAIFGYGTANTPFTILRNMTNLVSNTGVVATDTPGVGTIRSSLAAASYGGDKAIFGYGGNPIISPAAARFSNMTNLVSNTGVVATDTPGVGTARRQLCAASYGGDKAIFGYGFRNAPFAAAQYTSVTNLVSNTGVVATDTPGVGTARVSPAAAGYGGDKAIFGFGFGFDVLFTNLTNLVSNTGVVATDTPGVGTARVSSAAAGYSLTA
jgi:hypothetical protein